ncbi:MAG TPA: hypothetical protein VMS76_13075, partial [Planctomycetota bacterium]|nr:hypothetical protein [Planctomycetota bacterium]
MAERHPLSPAQSQIPRSQVGRDRRGSGSMMAVACVAAAGIVTGALYAIQKSTEAVSTAGAASARSQGHDHHRGVKTPIVEPIRPPREEIIEHQIAEDHLSTAQVLGIAQQERSPLGTLPLVRHGQLPLPGTFAADPEFNPEGRELTPELHAALEDLI